jgi:hypothetical protein
LNVASGGTLVAIYPSERSCIKIERGRIFYMSEDEGAASVASNFIWAAALIIIVGIIVAAFYYGGFLGGTKKHEIDVNISVPAR